MNLHSLVNETEILAGGKGDNPKGVFRKWLDSPAGQRELSRGITVEMEHTKKRAIAREIATDHLKEDRKYYHKLAKAGLDEGIYDDKAVWDKDTTDDVGGTGEKDDGEQPVNPKLLLALQAVESPNIARRYAVRGPVFKANVLQSIRELIAHAMKIAASIKDLPVQGQNGRLATESSMGVGGSGVVEPSTDAGSGMIINGPTQKRKRKLNKDMMTLGSPAKGSMVGADCMIPGRSAFAKGVE